MQAATSLTIIAAWVTELNETAACRNIRQAAVFMQIGHGEGKYIAAVPCVLYQGSFSGSLSLAATAWQSVRIRLRALGEQPLAILATALPSACAL